MSGGVVRGGASGTLSPQLPLLVAEAGQEPAQGGFGWPWGWHERGSLSAWSEAHDKAQWVELTAEQGCHHGATQGLSREPGSAPLTWAKVWRPAWARRGVLCSPADLSCQRTTASLDAEDPSSADPCLLSPPAIARLCPVPCPWWCPGAPTGLTSLWGSPAAEKMGIFWPRAMLFMTSMGEMPVWIISSG